MSRRPLAAALAVAVMLPATAAGEPPWSIDPRHPAPVLALLPGVPVLEPARVASSSPVQLVAEAALVAWMRGLTTVDGPTCAFYPTCSGYAWTAVRRHGWFVGGILAAERIMRSHADTGEYVVTRVGGVLRLKDPVGDHDSWF